MLEDRLANRLRRMIALHPLDRLVTSALFTLLHATHGLAYLLAVAPGFFLASVVYGYLALKSGSILPGMALHFAGDLAFVYFALLGGHSALLFAE